MTEEKYRTWYATLDAPSCRRLNYPNAIINKYKTTHRVPGGRSARPSIKQQAAEMARLQAHVAELEAARDDGDRFKVTDTDKDIAKAMDGRFPGSKGIGLLPNGSSWRKERTAKRKPTSKKETQKKESAEP